MSFQDLCHLFTSSLTCCTKTHMQTFYTNLHLIWSIQWEKRKKNWWCNKSKRRLSRIWNNCKGTCFLTWFLSLCADSIHFSTDHHHYQITMAEHRHQSGSQAHFFLWSVSAVNNNTSFYSCCLKNLSTWEREQLGGRFCGIKKNTLGNVPLCMLELPNTEPNTKGERFFYRLLQDVISTLWDSKGHTSALFRLFRKCVSQRRREKGSDSKCVNTRWKWCVCNEGSERGALRAGQQPYSRPVSDPLFSHGMAVINLDTSLLGGLSDMCVCAHTEAFSQRRYTPTVLLYAALEVVICISVGTGHWS